MSKQQHWNSYQPRELRINLTSGCCISTNVCTRIHVTWTESIDALLCIPAIYIWIVLICLFVRQKITYVRCCHLGGERARSTLILWCMPKWNGHSECFRISYFLTSCLLNYVISNLGYTASNIWMKWIINFKRHLNFSWRPLSLGLRTNKNNFIQDSQWWGRDSNRLPPE